MRIRSIRPEFWSSEDIAALDIPTRLLFIGLWSYVDDNGVGRDVEKLIRSELFPLEDDTRESLAMVSRGLQTLFDAGLITRYKVDGKPFLHIRTWSKHQKVDRPSKERYPTPTRGNTENPETLAKDSRQIRETPSTGEGEKGRRGTAKAGAAPAAENSGTLVKEWIDNQPRRPPDQVVGQVAKHVGQLLNGDGYPPEQVRSGLLAWQSRGLHPNALPSIVHEITTPRGRSKPRNQQETEAWLQEAMADATALDQADEQKELEA